MMFTRVLKAQECSLTLLDSPMMLCQQPLIILLTVYSSSKGFPVNLLRSEKNMFPSFPSRNYFLEFRIVFNQQRKKTGKVHIFFNLKQYKTITWWQWYYVDIVFSHLNHSKVPRQCLHTCARGHYKNTLLYITRHNFGGKEVIWKH